MDQRLREKVQNVILGLSLIIGTVLILIMFKGSPAAAELGITDGMISAAQTLTVLTAIIATIVALSRR